MPKISNMHSPSQEAKTFSEAETSLEEPPQKTEKKDEKRLAPLPQNNLTRSRKSRTQPYLKWHGTKHKNRELLSNEEILREAAMDVRCRKKKSSVLDEMKLNCKAKNNYGDRAQLYINEYKKQHQLLLAEKTTKTVAMSSKTSSIPPTAIGAQQHSVGDNIFNVILQSEPFSHLQKWLMYLPFAITDKWPASIQSPVPMPSGSMQQPVAPIIPIISIANISLMPLQMSDTYPVLKRVSSTNAKAINPCVDDKVAIIPKQDFLFLYPHLRTIKIKESESIQSSAFQLPKKR